MSGEWRVTSGDGRVVSGRLSVVSQRGFTLLEVLVATVIMAIAVIGLLSNLSTSLRTGARVTDFDKAAAVARERMNEILVDQKLPRFQPMEGRFDPNVTGWPEAGWRAEIRPFDAGPQPAAFQPVLDQVALEVWWNVGGQRKTYKLEGYRRGILRPEEVAMVAPQP